MMWTYYCYGSFGWKWVPLHGCLCMQEYDDDEWDDDGDGINKKISYRKQIARQHSCH